MLQGIFMTTDSIGARSGGFYSGFAGAGISLMDQLMGNVSRPAIWLHHVSVSNATYTLANISHARHWQRNGARHG
jgi:hypothetical protein